MDTIVQCWKVLYRVQPFTLCDERLIIAADLELPQIIRVALFFGGVSKIADPPAISLDNNCAQRLEQHINNCYSEFKTASSIWVHYDLLQCHIDIVFLLHILADKAERVVLYDFRLSSLTPVMRSAYNTARCESDAKASFAIFERACREEFLTLFNYNLGTHLSLQESMFTTPLQQCLAALADTRELVLPPTLTACTVLHASRRHSVWLTLTRNLFQKVKELYRSDADSGKASSYADEMRDVHHLMENLPDIPQESYLFVLRARGVAISKIDLCEVSLGMDSKYMCNAADLAFGRTSPGLVDQPVSVEAIVLAACQRSKSFRQWLVQRSMDAIMASNEEDNTKEDVQTIGGLLTLKIGIKVTSRTSFKDALYLSIAAVRIRDLRETIQRVTWLPPVAVFRDIDILTVTTNCVPLSTPMVFATALTRLLYSKVKYACDVVEDLTGPLATQLIMSIASRPPLSVSEELLSIAEWARAHDRVPARRKREIQLVCAILGKKICRINVRDVRLDPGGANIVMSNMKVFMMCEDVISGTVVCLEDPITRTVMQYPARLATCTHLNCFDAQSYITLGARTDQWDCPVCGEIGALSMVYIDIFHLFALRVATAAHGVLRMPRTVPLHPCTLMPVCDPVQNGDRLVSSSLPDADEGSLWEQP